MEAHLQFESVSNDGHKNVDGNCDPDLALYGVFGGAKEGLCRQILLDLEKEFDVPAWAIQVFNGLRWRNKVVGEEHQCFVGCPVEMPDAA